jgi:hypothetical protein
MSIDYLGEEEFLGSEEDLLGDVLGGAEGHKSV